MKILMIGNKESGKTTYMASAFGMMDEGVHGFYIHTDNITKEWFQRLYQQIGCGNYPDATDKRGSYYFNLYHNQKKIMDFEWIDYNGGIITDISIENLKKDIDSSGGIMIFLDSQALLNNDISTHKFRRIIALVSSKLESADSPLFSVIIVLTKYDKLPAGVDFEEVTESIRPFVEAADKNDKLYIRIVPVSCTHLGFYNVDLPLLDILDSGLKITYIMTAAEVKYYAEQAQDYSNRIGMIDWGISKLIRAKTNGELATEYREKALERLALFKSLETPVEQLSNYVSNYEIKYPNVSHEYHSGLNINNLVQFIDL